MKHDCCVCYDTGQFWDSTGETDELGFEIETLEPCWNCVRGEDAEKELRGILRKSPFEWADTRIEEE